MLLYPFFDMVIFLLLGSNLNNAMRSLNSLIHNRLPLDWIEIIDKALLIQHNLLHRAHHATPAQIAVASASPGIARQG